MLGNLWEVAGTYNLALHSFKARNYSLSLRCINSILESSEACQTMNDKLPILCYMKGYCLIAHQELIQGIDVLSKHFKIIHAVPDVEKRTKILITQTLLRIMSMKSYYLSSDIICNSIEQYLSEPFADEKSDQQRQLILALSKYYVNKELSYLEPILKTLRHDDKFKKDNIGLKLSVIGYFLLENERPKIEVLFETYFNLLPKEAPERSKFEELKESYLNKKEASQKNKNSSKHDISPVLWRHLGGHSPSPSKDHTTSAASSSSTPESMCASSSHSNSVADDEQNDRVSRYS